MLSKLSQTEKDMCMVYVIYLVWYVFLSDLFSLGIMPSLKPQGFPGGTGGKEPSCQRGRHKRCGFDPWVRKVPCRRKWQSNPVFLLGESHGQRSLAGYKESDTTEAT